MKRLNLEIISDFPTINLKFSTILFYFSHLEEARSTCSASTSYYYSIEI